MTTKKKHLAQFYFPPVVCSLFFQNKITWNRLSNYFKSICLFIRGPMIGYKRWS